MHQRVCFLYLLLRSPLDRSPLRMAVQHKAQSAKWKPVRNPVLRIGKTYLVVIIKRGVNRSVQAVIFLPFRNGLELRIRVCFGRLIEVLGLLEVWKQVLPPPALVAQSLPTHVCGLGSYHTGHVEHWTTLLLDILKSQPSTALRSDSVCCNPPRHVRRITSRHS